MKRKGKFPSIALHRVVLAVLITLNFSAVAQLPEDENIITNTFRNTIHINIPTTTIPGRYGFEFQLRHRFGSIKTDRTVVTDFLGTDLNANIQFGFAFPVGNTTMFGLSRAKSGKTYTVLGKQVIMRQRVDNRYPVSLAIYADVGVNTAEFKNVAPNTYFEDSVTPFKNKFTHRLTYTTQLLVSRKFGERLSLQLSPAFIYLNLVPAGMVNYTMALPLSLAVKTGTYSSFLLEYAYVINYRTENKLYPVSLGYEFGTAGHVFQIIASSSASLLEGNLYTAEQCNYIKGEFFLGFNMKRTFWHKKKIKRLSMLNNN